MKNLIILLFLLLLIGSALCYVYVPRNKHFPYLDNTLPNIVIGKTYYINMDKSTERKHRFLAGYNGKSEIERVPGVVVEKQIGKLGKGTRGCALAHAKAMNEVAKYPSGWYMICEDDCVGDFSSLESNIILRNIVHRTSKQFINLGRYKFSPYSLSDINLCLQAYMLTPECAAKTRDIIVKNVDSPHALPVDELIVSLYRTPRYFGQSGDSSGCHVTLFDAFGPSDISSNGR